jgi:hypothetical protein
MGSGQLTIELVGVEHSSLFQAQVRVQQELFCDLAALHALGEPDLLLHRQEVGVADLLEIEANRISNPRGEVFRICRSVSGALGHHFARTRHRLQGGLIEDFDSFGDQ